LTFDIEKPHRQYLSSLRAHSIAVAAWRKGD
jgi:hypothetical protein